MFSVRKAPMLLLALLIAFVCSASAEWGAQDWSTGGTQQSDWSTGSTQQGDWSTGSNASGWTDNSSTTTQNGWTQNTGSNSTVSSGNTLSGGWTSGTGTQSSTATEELGDDSIPLIYPALLSALAAVFAVFAYAKRKHA